MTTICRAFQTQDEAGAAVERLLAAGMPGDEIRVVTGEPVRDHGDAPAGSFAGRAGRLGSFADRPHAPHDGMGAFAGDAAQQRSGGFGDLDRETVTSYDDGVKRVHVASHRDVRRLLVDAGLDPDAAADDVEALHRGRVLVLVRTSAVEDAAAVLDGVAR